jgi:hypothetical protein
VTPATKARIVNEIGLQLEDWLRDLTADLQISATTNPKPLPHILMLHLTYAWLNLLLCRPLTVSSTPSANSAPSTSRILAYSPADAAERCNRAVARIVSLFRLWRAAHGLRFIPITATQIAFTAGATYVHLLSAGTGGRQEMSVEDALGGAKECFRCLQEMGMTWPEANKKASILEQLIEEWAASEREQRAPMPTKGRKPRHVEAPVASDPGFRPP